MKTWFLSIAAAASMAVPTASALAEHPGPCTVAWDYDGDSKPDAFQVFQYKGEQAIAESWYSPQSRNAYSRSQYVYDSRGNLWGKWIDSDVDGRPNELRAYSYDAQGRMEASAVDEDGRGGWEEVTYYSYEDGVRYERVQRRGRVRRTWAYRLVHTWDVGGGRYEGVDEDADGTIDKVSFVTLDEAGNVIAEWIDDDNDREFDTRAEYDYSCW